MDGVRNGTFSRSRHVESSSAKSQPAVPKLKVRFARNRAARTEEGARRLLMSLVDQESVAGIGK